MKLERLMYILIALLSQKRIIAKETAEKFQVSVRTIYRDIDTLTLAGIPIYSERGNNGGFFLAEKYKMNASLFTEEEQKFIKNISRNINQMIHYPSVDMLEKRWILINQTTRSAVITFLTLIPGIWIQIIWTGLTQLYTKNESSNLTILRKRRNKSNVQWFHTI